MLELGGGNDALNTVVPIGAGAGRYHDLRPTLTVSDPLPLDDDVGFHPNLAGLTEAVPGRRRRDRRGMGFEPYDLSHFGWLRRSGGAAGGAGPAGWLGRYLTATVGYDDPLAGVSIGPSPSAMLGQQSFTTWIADATGLRPGVPDWVGSPEGLPFAAWRGFAPARVNQAASLVARIRGAIRRRAWRHNESSARC